MIEVVREGRVIRRLGELALGLLIPVPQVYLLMGEGDGSPTRPAVDVIVEHPRRGGFPADEMTVAGTTFDPDSRTADTG
jgi:hypothetical protein